MTNPDHDEPAAAPGPTDGGGHGGMATRELEARRAEEAQGGEDSP